MLFLKDIVGFKDFPKSHKLPPVDAKFAKERDDDFLADRIVHRAVENIHLLITASSGTVVKDRIRRLAFKVGVTGIYFSEVGEKREKPTAALINPVP